MGTYTTSVPVPFNLHVIRVHLKNQLLAKMVKIMQWYWFCNFYICGNCTGFVTVIDYVIICTEFDTCTPSNGTLIFIRTGTSCSSLIRTCT